MEMTYHCECTRANRVKHIIDEIGIGQIVRKLYHNGTYTCITDTGITLIKDAASEKVITMYVTTYAELVRVFGGTKKIPPYLHKKVDRNQSKFTAGGKTIWR